MNGRPRKWQTFVSCRRASDYLKPGFVTGYICAVCGLELQVSPLAAIAIASGAISLCNHHGFRLVARLERQGLHIDMAAKSEEELRIIRREIESMKSQPEA
jgi:hypothetical protein